MSIQRQQLVDSANKIVYDEEEKRFKVIGAGSVTTFDIVFYHNSGEQNRVDKTNFLDDEHKLTISGVLREQSSIVNPSIVIYYATASNEDAFDFNYCYIDKFNRYYFIDNITSVAKDLWRIDMHCDSLMSYKTEILDNYAFVERNENTYDDKIIDSYKVNKSTYSIVTGTATADPDYETWHDNYDIWHTTIFPNSHDSIIAFIQGYPEDANRTKYESKFGITRIAMSADEFPKFVRAINEAPAILQDKTIYDCLINIVAVPYEPKRMSFNGSYLELINLPSKYIGNTFTWTFGNIETCIYDSLDFVWDISATIQRDKWEYYGWKYLLKFQPFGQFELDPQLLDIDNSVVGDNVTFIVKINLNIITGDANLYYGTGASNMFLLASSNVFQTLPYTSTKLDYTELAKGTINAFTTIATGGNAAMASANAVSTAFNSLTGQQAPPSSFNSGKMFVIDKKPTFKILIANKTSIEESLQGKPLYQYKQLSALSGFTKVGDVHLDDIDTATRPELDEIESKLKAGVILPSTP